MTLLMRLIVLISCCLCGLGILGFAGGQGGCVDQGGASATFRWTLKERLNIH